MRADDGRARKRQFSYEIFNGAEGEGGVGLALRAARSPSARHSEAIASSRVFKAGTECAQAVGCADHRDRLPGLDAQIHALEHVEFAAVATHECFVQPDCGEWHVLLVPNGFDRLQPGGLKSRVDGGRERECHAGGYDEEDV